MHLALSPETAPEAAASRTGGHSPRRCPVGVEALPGGRVHARVWAPNASRVALVVEPDAVGPDAVAPEGAGPDGRAVELIPERDGYFAGVVEGLPPGARYRFRLDDGAGGDALLPDPASRFQPEGPHGPSQLVDPSGFDWTDHAWTGRAIAGQVIYEMHIGTFTPEGTWDSALRELPALRDLGVTVLELMPVAEFAGRFGWGYDGVDLFAPTRLYGTPDGMRRFVDGAHALGLAVILDVVYNHFGPDGNYLTRFADAYVTDRYDNEWGDAINFDGPDAGPVREFFIANAAYWIDEFHLDGLRLDATQQIFDASTPNILVEIARAVRRAARGRATILIGENEPQLASLVRPPHEGGCGLDALWNDDFHHAATVALTGRNEAYYTDYRGTPQEFVSAVKHGFLYQGQWYRWQGKRRGMPAIGLPRSAFVTFLQNHDQIANSGRGLRGHAQTAPGQWRAMTALMLLAPGTPMLFQGQEFSASAPFHYFADHRPDLAAQVEAGRAEFLSQFRSLATPEMHDSLPKPHAEATFAACKLDHAERGRNAQAWALHRDLLRLRRSDPVFAAQGVHGIDGAVLGEEAFVLRFFGGDGGGGGQGGGGDDRLLLVNLGRDLCLEVVPEPLLAPPLGKIWALTWSSESTPYGGCGTAPVEERDRWTIPGHAALVMAPADPPESDSLNTDCETVPGNHG